MDQEKKQQALLEILTTVIVLLVYWISTQPEWKLEMYLRWITDHLPKPVVDKSRELTVHQKEILAKFRQEIRQWEEDNRAG